MMKSSGPFAGIPPEMADKTNALARQEPDFSDLDISFSYQATDQEPFGLVQFLRPYKFRMLGALLLVAIT
ncbi:MAG: hypothetical protein QNL70_11720, partial [Pseudomonas sp.]